MQFRNSCVTASTVSPHVHATGFPAGCVTRDETRNADMVRHRSWTIQAIIELHDGYVQVTKYQPDLGALRMRSLASKA